MHGASEHQKAKNAQKRHVLNGETRKTEKDDDYQTLSDNASAPEIATHGFSHHYLLRAFNGLETTLKIGETLQDRIWTQTGDKILSWKAVFCPQILSLQPAYIYICIYIYIYTCGRVSLSLSLSLLLSFSLLLTVSAPLSLYILPSLPLLLSISVSLSFSPHMSLFLCLLLFVSLSISVSECASLSLSMLSQTSWHAWIYCSTYREVAMSSHLCFGLLCMWQAFARPVWEFQFEREIEISGDPPALEIKVDASALNSVTWAITPDMCLGWCTCKLYEEALWWDNTSKRGRLYNLLRGMGTLSDRLKPPSSQNEPSECHSLEVPTFGRRPPCNGSSCLAENTIPSDMQICPHWQKSWIRRSDEVLRQDRWAESRWC